MIMSNEAQKKAATDFIAKTKWAYDEARALYSASYKSLIGGVDKGQYNKIHTALGNLGITRNDDDAAKCVLVKHADIPQQYLTYFDTKNQSRSAGR